MRTTGCSTLIGGYGAGHESKRRWCKHRNCQRRLPGETPRACRPSAPTSRRAGSGGCRFRLPEDSVVGETLPRAILRSKVLAQYDVARAKKTLQALLADVKTPPVTAAELATSGRGGPTGQCRASDRTGCSGSAAHPGIMSDACREMNRNKSFGGERGKDIASAGYCAVFSWSERFVSWKARASNHCPAARNQ